jgi:hypothetical protein
MEKGGSEIKVRRVKEKKIGAKGENEKKFTRCIPLSLFK